MRKVKYALTFLAGAGYVSSWWCVAIMDVDNSWIAIPLLIALFGGLGIAAAVVHSLEKHWKEE